MDLRAEESLEQLSMQFLKKNFRYLWLKAKLYRARHVDAPGATLMTGSSYGMNGILESMWNLAVNCSSSSQDLYYDFVCARDALMSPGGGTFVFKMLHNRRLLCCIS